MINDEGTGIGNTGTAGQDVNDQSLQTRMLLNEINKMLCFNQEQMKQTIESSIKASTSSIQASLGNQLSDITSHLDTLESRMKSLASSVKTKLSEMELKWKSHDNQLQIINEGQIKCVKQQTHLKSEMDTMKTMIKENKKTIEKIRTEKAKLEVDHQQAIAFRDDELKESQQKIKQLETDNRELKEKIQTLNQAVSKSNKSHEKSHAELDSKIELLGTKSRKNNVIVDGIQETENENLETILLSLTDAVSCDLLPSEIHAIYRFGTARGAKPRSIMVTLESPKAKDKIIQNVKEIKRKSTNKYLWFNKDQTDNTRRRTMLLKRCHALCVKNKHEAILKSDAITLEGKTYKYEELSLLPEKCRPEDTRMVITEDGTGVGFQSELVYLSNFYPCELRYEGQVYSSAEQAFQHIKARDAGYLKLANDILHTNNPYQLKHLGTKVVPKDEWIKSEVQTLKDVVKAKFEQNEVIRKHLINSPYTKFYEMTTSLKWATGVATLHMPVDATAFIGQNHHGLILEQLKQEFLDKSQIK